MVIEIEGYGGKPIAYGPVRVRACSRNKCAFRRKVALVLEGYCRSERGRLAGFPGNELGVVAC